MQLMWISESTGKIRRIPVTLRTILIAIVCAALFFIVIGALLNFVGFRIAIEQKPEIARAMGGVITSQQQQEIEQAYREQLTTLNEQIQVMAAELVEVKKIKNKFAELATPKSLRSELESSSGGVGGPYKSPKTFANEKDFFQSLDDSVNDAKNFKRHIVEIRKDWERQVAWLNSLPSSTPISGSYKITSGFGRRMDPFTGNPAHHEGLDFSAQTGTLIVASGDGVVHQVGFQKEYGNYVEIKHKGGYKSRYAHASELLVKEGDRVKREDPIARVGNTGRSTGSHLHYEIMKDGGFFRSDTKLNPAGMLILVNAD